MRINVDLAIFQPYLDLEAGDNQSLKIQVARPGIEPRSSCSASQSLTTRPPLLLIDPALSSLSVDKIFNLTFHTLIGSCYLNLVAASELGCLLTILVKYWCDLVVMSVIYMLCTSNHGLKKWPSLYSSMKAPSLYSTPDFDKICWCHLPIFIRAPPRNQVCPSTLWFWHDNLSSFQLTAFIFHI